MKSATMTVRASRIVSVGKQRKTRLTFLTLIGFLLLMIVNCWSADTTTPAVHRVKKSQQRFISRQSAVETPKLYVELGHSMMITSVALSQNGRYAVMGDQDNTASLWELNAGREIRRFVGHSAAIYGVAVSRTGQYALTGSLDGTARIWEMDTGREVHRFDVRPYQISGVAFSPTGDYILTGSSDNTVRLWSVKTGVQVRQFTGHTDRVAAVAFSSSGNLAVSASFDKTAILWDLATGRQVRQFKGHRGHVNSMAVSADGKYLLTGSDDQTARLWELSTGKEIKQFREGLTDVTSVSFSSDGSMVLTGSLNQHAALWNRETGTQIRDFEWDSPVTASVLSMDKEHLLLGGLEGKAALFDLNTGKNVRELESGASPINAIAFSPDQRYVITGGRDKIAHLWDLRAGKEIRQFRGHLADINSVAISPDNKYVLTGSGSPLGLDDDTARLWELDTGKEVRRFKGHRSGITCAGFSPDGRYVFTASYDKTAYLWDSTSGAAIQEFSNLPGAVYTFRFSPDRLSIMLATIKDEGGQGNTTTLSMWQVSAGKLLKELGSIPNAATLEFSHDFNFAIVGNKGLLGGRVNQGENIAFLLNVRTKEVKEFKGHSASVNAVAFSPDEHYILTGSADSTTRIWDKSTGVELCKLLSFRDGTWAIVDSQGRFDTNHPEALSTLSWIMPDDRLHPLPLEMFMRDYYEPHLLSRILSDRHFDEPRPLANLNRAQPIVTITDIRPDPNSDNVLSITVQVSPGRYIRPHTAQVHQYDSGIYDLRLFRNGQLVAAEPEVPATIVADYPAMSPRGRSHQFLEHWRESARLSADSQTGKYLKTFNVRIPHNTQRLEFSAYAYNADRVKGPTTNRTYELPSPIRWGRGHAYLITIGVAAHSNPEFDLLYPATDARELQNDLYTALSRSGRYDQVSIISLVSDYITDKMGECTQITPTKEAIRAVTDVLAGRPISEEVRRRIACLDRIHKVGPDDLVVISFSGHGFSPTGDIYYLFPYDGAKIHSDDIRAFWDSAASLISSEELFLWLRDIDAKDLVVILDTCQSAAAAGPNFKPGPLDNRDLGQLAYDKKARLIVASQADNQAVGLGILKHSLLSYSLTVATLEAKREDRLAFGDWLLDAAERVRAIYETNVPEEIRRRSKVQEATLFDFSESPGPYLLLSEPSSQPVEQLIASAASGDLVAMDEILAAGTDPNAQDSLGNVPLIGAARQGYMDVITVLLANGAKVNEKDGHNSTALMAAAASGHSDVIKLLLKNGADPLEQDNLAGRGLDQPASRSRYGGSAQDVIIPKETASIKHGALQLAALRNDIETATVLLTKNSYAPNELDASGTSAIHLAVLEEHAGMVNLLLEHGANINLINREGSSPLLDMIASGTEPFVRLLLARGADPNVSDRLGQTALHRAILANRPDLLVPLQEKGANVNARDNAGEAPLHIAARYGCLECVDVLISGKADIEARDLNGNTALHIAVSGNQRHVVEVLLGKGARVNSSGHRGYSPLHEAALKGTNRTIAQLLVEHGADLNAVDDQGKKPVEVAVDAQMKKFLMQYVDTTAISVSPTYASIGEIHNEANRDFEQYMDRLKKIDDELKAEDEWRGKAEQLASEEKFEEAEQAYHTAIKIFQFDERTRYGFGLLLEKLHRYEEAEQEYSVASTLKPEKREFRDALERVRKLRGSGPK